MKSFSAELTPTSGLANRHDVNSIRMSTPADGDRMVEIWRSAVDATHHFLDAGDLAAIDAEVRAFLPDASMWLALDDSGRPIAFMGLTGTNMDALFVDAPSRGTGVGRALVNFAAARYSELTTQVNEQNKQAVGFYERMGFVTFGRSETDDEGRPYPLLHMKRSGSP